VILKWQAGVGGWLWCFLACRYKGAKYNILYLYIGTSQGIHGEQAPMLWVMVLPDFDAIKQ
jgi:hypothetical protein